MDETDEEAPGATAPQPARPREISQFPGLYGSHRRYADVQEHTLSEAIRDPIVPVGRLYLKAESPKARASQQRAFDFIRIGDVQGQKRTVEISLPGASGRDRGPTRELVVGESSRLPGARPKRLYPRRSKVYIVHIA